MINSGTKNENNDRKIIKICYSSGEDNVVIMDTIQIRSINKLRIFIRSDVWKIALQKMNVNNGVHCEYFKWYFDEIEIIILRNIEEKYV